MEYKDYINKIILENIEGDVENIDFQKEFIEAGDSFERDVTIDDVDPIELEMGIEEEMEHVSDSENSRIIARKIALDHLANIKDYYTRLAKMEEEAFEELGKPEALEEKRKKRKKKKKKNLYRGYIGYFASPHYGDYDGDSGDGDAGGDGGD